MENRFELRLAVRFYRSLENKNLVYIQFRTLILTQFKNYSNQTIQLMPGFNLIYGSNGSGKTNVLDAIHYLGLAKSHFLSQDKMAIQIGTDFFRLEGHLDQASSHRIKVVLKYQAKNKSLEWNDLPVDRIIDHIGRIGIVMIAPDDLEVIDGLSNLRRRFMDVTLSQTDPIYLQNLSTYKKVLDQRNAHLKQHVHPDPLLIQVLNEKMNVPALFLYQSRKLFIEVLNPLFKKYYNSISGAKETVSINFQSDLYQTDLLQVLLQAYPNDLRNRNTSKGSHKDELQFKINDLDVRYHASQGQKKTFLVSLFLAQAAYMAIIMSAPPIILLDDIFDKLDPKRVQFLMATLKNLDGSQILMTDTTKDRMQPIIETLGIKAQYIYVEHGTCQSIN